MIAFNEPITRILRDFCHVEWYEVDELSRLVNNEEAKFDVVALKGQFESLISEPEGAADFINRLTSNEFESDEEACIWLERIYKQVFN